MDKYDKAIEYLKEHPQDIIAAFANPFEYIDKGGELFKWMSETGRKKWFVPNPANELRLEEPLPNLECGCVLSIHNQKEVIFSDEEGDIFLFNAIDKNNNIDRELTNKIIADERIPRLVRDINADNLRVFAEYQRLADERYGRK